MVNLVNNTLGYYVQQLQTVIEDRVVVLSMNWLEHMMVGMRDHSSELELFSTVKGFNVTPESLNHLLPPVITCYTMARDRCGEAVSALGTSGAMPLSGFVKGVASLNNLVEGQGQDYVADLLMQQIIAVVEHQSYPAVSERFWPAYSDIAVAILLNEELTTWADILGFNLGVWWLMGFLKDSEIKQDGVPGKLDYHAQLKRMLLEYARQGVVYSG